MLYLGFQSQSDTMSENLHSKSLVSCEYSSDASQTNGLPVSDPLIKYYPSVDNVHLIIWLLHCDPKNLFFTLAPLDDS
jgi:hypothetical protein